MIEKGDCLQDVHIALANALLQQQFPDRAGFQSTLYVANGRCSPQKEGTIQIHFDEVRKHWLTSSFSNRRIQIFDSRYTGFIPDGVKKQMRATLYIRSPIQAAFNSSSMCPATARNYRLWPLCYSICCSCGKWRRPS